MADDLPIIDEDIINLANQFSNEVDNLTTQFPNEVEDVTQVPNKVARSTKNSSRRGANFSINDDKLICAGWLNTSKDSTQGTDQSSNRYWQRITTFFNSHTTNLRTQPSIKQRWVEINRKCQLFAGYTDQIERKNASGQTIDDKEQEAKQMFIDLEGKPFPFEHCWPLLKDEPKWREILSNKKHKSDNVNETINLGDNDEPSINTDRPMGTKAAKKLATCSSSSSISDAILQERLKIEKDKYEQRNRALLGQEKDRELKQKEIELKQKEMERKWAVEERNWEVEVMTKDFQGMSPIKVQYWQNERKAIMAKKGFTF